MLLSPSQWFLCRPIARHVRLTSNSACIPRRGQNLTERYRRLEITTRAKPERATHVSVLPQGSESSAEQPDGFVRTSITPDTIAGFVIPQEPRVPADDECCMSGCAVCVYDLYEEALVEYKNSVTALRAALSARHIPETEWPAHIRTGNTNHTTPTAAEKSKSAMFDAFKEMERALKEKWDKRAAIESEKRARGDVSVGDGERIGLDLRGLYEGVRWVIFPSR